MPRRRLAALSLATLAAAVAAGTARAAGDYKGDAQTIALTAAQAKYKALTGSAAAPTPPADKRRGYRDGWQVGYVKGTPAKPVQGYALIYVYKTQADARRAFVNSCDGCSKTYQVRSVLTKYRLQKKTAKQEAGAIDIATCRNVYVATAVSGDLGQQALVDGAAALAGGVFAKAAANGMSSCAS